MTVVKPNGDTTNYSQEMMISYYKQNDSSYEPLYSSKDDAQAADETADEAADEEAAN